MSEVIPVSVSITGGSSMSNRAIDGVTIDYAVADIPKAVVSLHEVAAAGEETPARRVMVSAEAEKMREFQEHAFQGQANEATINIAPLSKGTVGHTFTGNVLGPERSVYTSYYSNGGTLVHRMEAVNSYTPHIYSLAYVLNNDTEEFYKAKYDNVFTMLKVLLEKRHKDFDAMFENAHFNDAASKEAIQQIHNNNMTVYPVLSQILADSATYGGVTYNAFKSINEDALIAINTSIFNTLKATLFGSSQQFFFSLVAVADQFQSFFVPPYDGESEYGYFRPNRFKVEDKIVFQARLTGVRMTSTKLDNFPIQQVIVSGPPPNLNNAGVNPAAENNNFSFLGDNTTYAVYPKDPPKTNGNNLPMPMPSWLPADVYTMSSGINGDAKRDLSLASSRAERSKLYEKVTTTVIPAVASLMKEYAMTAYKNTALASYSATLTCVPTFELIPGRRYEILDEDGSSLFSGFLNSIQHKISGLSSSLSVDTTLSFYAVSYTTFTLPE